MPTTAPAATSGPDPSLERVYAAIRAVTRVPADWPTVVDAVVAELRGIAELRGKVPPNEQHRREDPDHAHR